MNGQSADDFRGGGITPCDTIRVETCHYVFVQTRGTCRTSGESSCRPWAWVRTARAEAAAPIGTRVPLWSRVLTEGRPCT